MVFKKTFYGAALAALALTLNTDLDAQAQKKSVTKKLNIAAAEDVTVVDETYNAKRIILYVGDRLVIRLNSNPRTGHRWAWVETNPRILMRLDGRAPLKNGPAESAQFFQLKALKPGQTVVEIDYEGPRGFEELPSKTFQLRVVVVPGSERPVDDNLTLRRRADRNHPRLEGTNFMSSWNVGRFWGNRPPGSAYEGPVIGPGGIALYRF